MLLLGRSLLGGKRNFFFLKVGKGREADDAPSHTIITAAGISS